MKFDNIKIAVIGGDIRMTYCIKKLYENGFEVSYCGFDNSNFDFGGAVRCKDVKDALSGASAVVLPVPVTVDGCRLNCPYSSYDIRLDGLFSLIKPSQLILAGVCSQSLLDRADMLGLNVQDYMKDEELTVKNAVPTAEGALEVALRELPFTLRGSNVLITGYGRVGKVCAALFSAVKSRVTVCVRRADAMAHAYADGYDSADISNLCKAVPDYDVIVNTVPHKIIDNNVLSHTNKKTLIIDLASMPGGVDDDAAKKYGIKVIHALSLPGRCAPETSGGYIADTVSSILIKRGVI